MICGAAYILAGGKGGRFIPHKGLLEIGGRPIISRQIDVLKDIFRDVIIITNAPNLYESLGVLVIKDAIPRKGPLGGIYSALLDTDSDYNFIVAADMPCLNPSLIKYILNSAGGYDAAVPEHGSLFEPLHSVYSKNCIGKIKKQIKNNELKIADLFSQLKVRKITQQEISRFDPGQASFININTEKDYRMINNIGGNYARPY